MRNSMLLIALILFFSSCAKRNFFPDEDDPGLSRLTFYGYNIATNYINGVAYINPFRGSLRGNSLPTLTEIHTNNDFNTLRLSWRIERNDSIGYNAPYKNISLLMPVSKNFGVHDFIAMSGKRFSPNTNSIVLNSNYPDTIAGLSNLYFIKITMDTNYLSFSGLFDGNIGDSIFITKGRFDFKIESDAVNF